MINYSDKIYEILSILNKKMKENDMVLSLSVIEENTLFDGIEALSATTMDIITKIIEEIELLIKDSNQLSEDEIKNKINNKNYKKTKDNMSFSNIEISYFIFL